MVGDIGRHDAAPLVIVYPEAVIYGPVTLKTSTILLKNIFTKVESLPISKPLYESSPVKSPG